MPETAETKVDRTILKLKSIKWEIETMPKFLGKLSLMGILQTQIDYYEDLKKIDSLAVLFTDYSKEELEQALNTLEKKHRNAVQSH